MHTAKRPLAEVNVLVTRPEEQAEALCRMIEAAGGRAIRMPLLRVTPLPITDATQTAFDFAARSRVVIFISRNAVRYGEPPLRVRLAANPGCTVIGVGSTTTDALLEAGLNPLRLPAGTEASSEGLLALDALTASRIAGQQVLIVRGKGGRELLADTLRQRGAEVRYAEVYRRIPNESDMASTLAEAVPPRVSIITSVEGLERFAELLRTQGREEWFVSPLAVLSWRIAGRAADLGFGGAIEVAAQASDAGLLDAAIALINHRH